MLEQLRNFKPRQLLLGAATLMLLGGSALTAQAGPGDGKTIPPMSTGRADHYFQHFVVQIGLERLGYQVKEHLEGQFPAMHLSIAQGDADYTAVHWDPLHQKFYDEAGGDAKLTRVGKLIEGAAQGCAFSKLKLLCRSLA